MLQPSTDVSEDQWCSACGLGDVVSSLHPHPMHASLRTTSPLVGHVSCLIGLSVHYPNCPIGLSVHHWREHSCDGSQQSLGNAQDNLVFILDVYSM